MTLPGVKRAEANSDDLPMEQIRRARIPDLVLYSGYMTKSSLPACWRARTALPQTYNIMGWRCRRIVQAREGDVAKAQRLQTEVQQGY